jgi:hypothetical protein
MRGKDRFRFKFQTAAVTSHSVIAGLDPAIHSLRKMLMRRLMDARINSGHDGCPCVDISFAEHSFAISPHDPREFCQNLPLSENRGRRECRALNAPAASHAKIK